MQLSRFKKPIKQLLY